MIFISWEEVDIRVFSNPLNHDHVAWVNCICWFRKNRHLWWIALFTCDLPLPSITTVIVLLLSENPALPVNFLIKATPKNTYHHLFNLSNYDRVIQFFWRFDMHIPHITHQSHIGFIYLKQTKNDNRFWERM